MSIHCQATQVIAVLDTRSAYQERKGETNLCLNRKGGEQNAIDGEARRGPFLSFSFRDQINSPSKV